MKSYRISFLAISCIRKSVKFKLLEAMIKLLIEPENDEYLGIVNAEVWRKMMNTSRLSNWKTNLRARHVGIRDLQQKQELHRRCSKLRRERYFVEGN